MVHPALVVLVAAQTLDRVVQVDLAAAAVLVVVTAHQVHPATLAQQATLAATVITLMALAVLVDHRDLVERLQANTFAAFQMLR